MQSDVCLCVRPNFKGLLSIHPKAGHFTLVKEALIEIGCVVTSLVVTRVHCGQTVHPRPIVTMEH